MKINIKLHCVFLAVSFFYGCDSTKMVGEKPAEEAAKIRNGQKAVEKTAGTQDRNSLHRSPNARLGLGRLR